MAYRPTRDLQAVLSCISHQVRQAFMYGHPAQPKKDLAFLTLCIAED